MFETKQCQEFVCGVQARKLLEQLDECAELRILCWISALFGLFSRQKVTLPQALLAVLEVLHPCN